MNDSIIYEKHYPKVELAQVDDSEKQTEPLNFEQIMEKNPKRCSLCSTAGEAGSCKGVFEYSDRAIKRIRN